ncbi:MAG: class I SAM-dependent methyltransferase [Solirubrobacteraceae bacterium]
MYAERSAEGVSWAQERPAAAIAALDRLGLGPERSAVDVGGGTSWFAAELIGRGFDDVTVLDISVEALRQAQGIYGKRAARVRWLAADLLEWTPERRYDLWHDRAVFHFLTGETERRRYREVLSCALAVGGCVIAETFALDGPDRCSGRPVVRYSAAQLHSALAPDMGLVAQGSEIHRTPSGGEQPFTWIALRDGR